MDRSVGNREIGEPKNEEYIVFVIRRRRLTTMFAREGWWREALKRDSGGRHTNGNSYQQENSRESREDRRSEEDSNVRIPKRIGVPSSGG